MSLAEALIDFEAAQSNDYVRSQTMGSELEYSAERETLLQNEADRVRKVASIIAYPAAIAQDEPSDALVRSLSSDIINVEIPFVIKQGFQQATTDRMRSPEYMQAKQRYTRK